MKRLCTLALMLVVWTTMAQVFDAETPLTWVDEPTSNPNSAEVQEQISNAEAAVAAGDYAKAAKAYSRLNRNSRSSNNMANSLIAQGDMYLQLQDYDSAVEAYQKAVDTYGSRIPLLKVIKAEYDIATDHYLQTFSGWGIFKSNGNFKANKVYDHILKSAPYSDYAALALFRSGLAYQWEKQYIESADQLRKMINRFPDSRLTGYAMIELARSLLLNAERSDGDGTLASEAKQVLRRFFQTYPDHPKKGEAASLLIQANEQEAARLLHLGKFYLRELSYSDEAARRYLSQIVSAYGETQYAQEAKDLLASIGVDSSSISASEGAGMDGNAGTGGLAGIPAIPEAEKRPVKYMPKNPNEKWLLPLVDLSEDKPATEEAE
mgnify:CR=1 FL=1